MALSKDTPRAYELGDINELPMTASATIYEGSAVGISSGYASALADGYRFAGFALEKAVESSGVAGAKTVKVIEKGKMQVTLASVAVTDVGSKVYMSDDGTFTLTASPGELVGRVVRYVTTDTCVIEFYPTAA